MHASPISPDPDEDDGIQGRVVEGVLRLAHAPNIGVGEHVTVTKLGRKRHDCSTNMRILLVSQMYPGPEDPDLGIFVANLERELAARGH